jgi:hypothetical protein
MRENKAMILAAMAPAEGSPFTPVQIQKLMFLIDEELSPGLGSKLFNFRPYNYGPFDGNVYGCLDALVDSGYIDLVPILGQRWSSFKTTEEGQTVGEQKLDQLDPWVKEAIETYSDWVRSLSFTQLVSAIYKKYPEMKSNSVFNR